MVSHKVGSLKKAKSHHSSEILLEWDAINVTPTRDSQVIKDLDTAPVAAGATFSHATAVVSVSQAVIDEQEGDEVSYAGDGSYGSENPSQSTKNSSGYIEDSDKENWEPEGRLTNEVCTFITLSSHN